MAEAAWATVAGLGLYHGLNPAMGWLFAVALGLHRGSRAALWRALVPIALGHALAVVLAVALIVGAGAVFDLRLVRAAAGGVLIAWALYHLVYGARHRVRVGMRVGFAGLALWSFAMAWAHGAGLMLVPALLSLCFAGAPAPGPAPGALGVSVAAVGVHTAAMLAATALVAAAVYEWVGLGFLRRGWINLDLLWSVALLATGAVLLAL